MVWDVIAVPLFAGIIGLAIGFAIGRVVGWIRAKADIALLEEERQMQVQREMHDAKRTHLPREGAPPTRVSKATFRGRPE
jgi:hypothetical protein